MFIKEDRRMKRNTCFLLFLWIFACLIGIQSGSAQVSRPKLDQGISLYRAGQWTEAAQELQRARKEAVNPGQEAEALYWLSLAEFSLGEYEAALRNINDLQRIAPAGLRMDDILFYKGRTLYYLKRYEEALTQFRTYGTILGYQTSSGAQAEKSVIAYWMGECYYALGRKDQAAVQFTSVINARPWGEKHEAAAYRLELIQPTKTQAETLDKLTGSYTEYLKTVEEYQRLLAEAEARIHDLDVRLTSVAKAVGVERSAAPSLDPGPEHSVVHIREQKARAEKLRNDLATSL
jgi:TolA-binding protein